MKPIIIINRETGQKEQEKVFGDRALKFLYGNDLVSRIFGAPLLHLLVRFSIFSALYGWWQKQSWTKSKIRPFVENYGVDTSEFAPIDTFQSFNDFFIRKLNKDARPLSESPLIIPADGRYLFFQDIGESDHFIVKDQKFNLTTLLQDEQLAERYVGGAMVIGRLCPTDYHRFHFPCDCIPGEAKLINGKLFSVNPIAIKQRPSIFFENKRCITALETEEFGTIQYLEIGATCVGSIHQTFTPGKQYSKGDEKGYFSFGASALVLLFEPGKVKINQDLIAATDDMLEVRCLLGQSM